MEIFKRCKLCNQTYHHQCGEFFNHIKDQHNLTKEEYVVLTEYSDKHPMCQCGVCNELAKFIPRKNKFYVINPEHRAFDWLEEQYIKKYGNPKCKTCEKDVKFHRGRPNRYCSPSCLPSQWNQEKVRATIMLKYNVTNVMKVKEFKDKLSLKLCEVWENNKDEIINKRKQTNLERYGDEDYFNLNKHKETLINNYGVDSYSKTDKFRKDSSKRMLENNPMKNEQTVKKMIDTYINNVENGITKLYKTKSFKNTNLHYQSTYEYNFLVYCENLGILHLIKNSKGFKYLNEDIKIGYRHLPDFIFKDKYIIEIKSTWILNRQGGMEILDAKKRSVENYGYKYILILDNDFSEFNLIINN